MFYVYIKTSNNFNHILGYFIVYSEHRAIGTIMATADIVITYISFQTFCLIFIC